MATSPSEPVSQPVPPEVIAIAVALAMTMQEPASDGDGHQPRPPDVGPWRWQAWD